MKPLNNGRDYRAEASDLLKQLHKGQSSDFDAALDVFRKDIIEFKPYVFEALKSATDLHVKGGLIELLGNSKDPEFLPRLAQELESESREVRFWAYVAIQEIGTTDARDILRNVDVKSWKVRDLSR